MCADWCVLLLLLLLQAGAVSRCTARTAWMSAAVIGAFLRSNSAHPFRDVILRPDMLPILTSFASPLTSLDELIALLCSVKHLHQLDRDRCRLLCSDQPSNSSSSSSTLLKHIYQQAVEQQQQRYTAAARLSALASTRFIRSISTEAQRTR